MEPSSNSALDAGRLDGRSPAAPPPKAAGTARLPFNLTIDALDRRRAPFKRYETIRAGVLADVAAAYAAGEANISEVQRQLISKFATLALQLELMEAAALEGQTIDLDLFGRCAGHLRRIAETLGIERRPRDVTPGIDEIAAEIKANKRQIEEIEETVA